MTLSVEQRRWTRELAAAVAASVASVGVVEVEGNVCLQKPELVVALARYFTGAGVDAGVFVERCYGLEEAGAAGQCGGAASLTARGG